MGINKINNGSNINNYDKILHLILYNDRVNLNLKFICQNWQAGVQYK